MTLARAHYENFPVASILLPSRLRPHIAAVYAFARTADDLADEGTQALDVRLRNLAFWETTLDRGTREGTTDSSATLSETVPPELVRWARMISPALQHTIETFRIDASYFRALLDAFRQDASGYFYETFEEVLDYCRRSAVPVGRILLALFGCTDERAYPPSDALCTGLQLVNFWQDIAIDTQRGRCYVPDEDKRAFGCMDDDFRRVPETEAFRELMRFEVERTWEFFRRARPLFPLVSNRFRLELRAVWEGGSRILDKIRGCGYTVISNRPKITIRDAVFILARTLAHARSV
ncbi:MAG: squalene synthase HpnC [Bacteroidota bacterium]|nr:squalene synthase HpnC [Bacteroidota bacterium]